MNTACLPTNNCTKWDIKGIFDSLMYIEYYNGTFNKHVETPPSVKAVRKSSKHDKITQCVRNEPIGVHTSQV